MKSLNEKLAEVCGLTLQYHPMCGNVYRTMEGLTMYEEGDWNPTTDLNQLRECWNTLTWEQKATYKQLVIDHDVQSVFDVPAQHAELILKAKGVSL